MYNKGKLLKELFSFFYKYCGIGTDFLDIVFFIGYNQVNKNFVGVIIMELSGIVFIQVLIIFILMSVGFVFAKAGIINEKGSRQMTDILLLVVAPCVLINAYQKEFTPNLVKGLVFGALFSILIHIVGIVLSTLIFKKEETLRYRVNIFASVYSNCGFMAIPILSATLGSDGVFYGSAYFAIFNLLYWTHGICVYDGSIKAISAKNIIKSPGIIGTVIAIILFVLGIKLPYVIKESVTYIASINTPLAMIVMGAYLTRVDFKKAIKNASMYLVLAMRLVIIPVIAVFLAKLFNMESIVAKSILISAACPTASVTALMAAKYDLDAAYATEIVSVSTIISIISIPLVIMLY